MEDLYREIIVERYKNPQYKGILEPNTLTFEDENPLCGDRIRIDIRVDELGKISEASYSGHGCAISQASSDLLLESIIGKSLDEIKVISKQDILDLLGIELGPVRLKCALLPLKVVKGAIYGVGSLEDLVDEE
jgi:nitrogen fixation NifU-like protein